MCISIYIFLYILEHIYYNICSIINKAQGMTLLLNIIYSLINLFLHINIILTHRLSLNLHIIILITHHNLKIVQLNCIRILSL